MLVDEEFARAGLVTDSAILQRYAGSRSDESKLTSSQNEDRITYSSEALSSVPQLNM